MCHTVDYDDVQFFSKNTHLLHRFSSRAQCCIYCINAILAIIATKTSCLTFSFDSENEKKCWFV